MAGFYETWLKSPGFGPNWMHDPVGNAYWGVVGSVMDQQVDRMKLGMRCRYPLDAAAAGLSDALEELGKDRMLPRGGTAAGGTDEAYDAYAARLVNAWATWAKAGTPQGLLIALKAAGFPTGATGAMIVNHIGMAYTLDGSGNLVVSQPCAECVNRANLSGVVPSTKLKGFTLDARDQFFSHFAILFLQDVAGLYNTDGNAAKVALNQIVKRWRCGGAIYNGASVIPADKYVFGWPPTIKFGDAGLTFSGSTARFIDPE